MTTTHTVRAQRDGRYWLVWIDGALRTQARRQREIEPMARDWLANMHDRPAADFTVRIEIALPDSVRAHLEAGLFPVASTEFFFEEVYRDTDHLEAYLRQNPAKLNYGSAGNGTSHHLAGELFKLLTKTFITHIPYRGAGPALQDLITGNADLMFDGLGSSAAHIKGGRIRALMVAGKQRNAALPDVPSAAEMGLPDYNVTTWYGVWAPKGTPADAQARMAEEIRKAIQSERLKQVWANQGAEFPNLNPQQFTGFIDGEVRQWSQVVKASNVKAD